ncbi:MAG: hypothetical protein ABI857_04105 [Acidobacteriota bacterium]
MKTSAIIFTLLIIGLSAQLSFGQSEKELVIKTARALEETPLDKETIKMREQALKWVIETDQVTVGLCGGVVGLFSDKKYKYSGDLITTYTIAMAAFKLQNPDKKSDEKAAQLVGLESALKTYERILKEKPKAKSDTLDSLVSKRNTGELSALVATIDCSKQ